MNRDLRAMLLLRIPELCPNRRLLASESADILA